MFLCRSASFCVSYLGTWAIPLMSEFDCVFASGSGSGSRIDNPCGARSIVEEARLAMSTRQSDANAAEVRASRLNKVLAAGMKTTTCGTSGGYGKHKKAKQIYEYAMEKQDALKYTKLIQKRVKGGKSRIEERMFYAIYNILKGEEYDKTLLSKFWNEYVLGKFSQRKFEELRSDEDIFVVISDLASM